jgi:hypothetical protein
MTKLTEVTKRFQFKEFEYTVNIVLTEDIQASENKIADRWGFASQKLSDGCMGLHIGIGGKGVSYVLLKFRTDFQSVVHESFHVVWRLFRHIGADFEEEVMAYCLDHVVGEIESLYFSTKVQEMQKKLDRREKTLDKRKKRV